MNYIPAFDPLTEDPLDVPYESSSIWFTGAKDRDVSIMKEDPKKKLLLEKQINSDREHDHGEFHNRDKPEIGINDVNRPRHEHEEYRKRDIPKISSIDLPTDVDIRQKKYAQNHHTVKDLKNRIIVEAEGVESNAEAVLAIKKERKDGAGFLREKIPILSYSQEFLVNHARSKPEDQGMWFLPYPIQVSVLFLFCGLILSILHSAKSSRRRNRNFNYRLGGSKVV